jgi:transcription antitermination factor NusG
MKHSIQDNKPVQEKVWRAFYTKPRHELKIASRLEDAGIINYCPVIKTKVRWSDRWKKVTKPALPGYVFAQVDEHERIQVLQDESVLHNVMWNKKLVEITADEIELMMLVLDDAEKVELDDLSEGDRVEISRGSMVGLKGVVLQVSNKTVRLRIDSIQCDMLVNVPIARIEKLKERSSKD